MFCDDIQDMYLTNALTSIVTLFVEHLTNLPAEISNFLKSKVDEWMRSQALFIQALFGNLSWKVELLIKT